MKYEFMIIVIFAARAVNNNYYGFIELDGFNLPVKVNLGSRINVTFVLNKTCTEGNSKGQEQARLITIDRKSTPLNPDDRQMLCIFTLDKGLCLGSENCSCHMSPSIINFTLSMRADDRLNGSWKVSSNIAGVRSLEFDIIVSKEVWREENETIYELDDSETSINFAINSTSRPLCHSLQLLENHTQTHVSAELGQEESCPNVTELNLYCNNVDVKSTQPWLVRVKFPDTTGERRRHAKWRLVLAIADGRLCVNKYFQILHVKKSGNSSLHSDAKVDNKDKQPANIEKIAASVSVASVLVIFAFISITVCIRRSVKNLQFRSSNMISLIGQGNRPTRSGVFRDSFISVDINNHLYQDCRRPSQEEITARYAVTPQPHKEMMEENPFGPRPSMRCHAPPETLDAEDRTVMKVIDFSRKPCIPLNVYVNVPNVRAQKTRIKAKGAVTKARSLGNLYANLTNERAASEKSSYRSCNRSISF